MQFLPLIYEKQQCPKFHHYLIKMHYLSCHHSFQISLKNILRFQHFRKLPLFLICSTQCHLNADVHILSTEMSESRKQGTCFWPWNQPQLSP